MELFVWRGHNIVVVELLIHQCDGAVALDLCMN